MTDAGIPMGEGPSLDPICARCGCFRSAHENDDGELFCPPGSRFTPPPAAAGDRALAIDLYVRLYTILATLKAEDFSNPDIGHAYAEEARELVAELEALRTPEPNSGGEGFTVTDGDVEQGARQMRAVLADGYDDEAALYSAIESMGGRVIDSPASPDAKAGEPSK